MFVKFKYLFLYCLNSSNSCESSASTSKQKQVYVGPCEGDSRNAVRLYYCKLCSPSGALMHNGYFPVSRTCSTAVSVELLLLLRAAVLESRTLLYMACNAFSLRYLPLWIEEVGTQFCWDIRFFINIVACF